MLFEAVSHRTALAVAGPLINRLLAFTMNLKRRGTGRYSRVQTRTRLPVDSLQRFAQATATSDEHAFMTMAKWSRKFRGMAIWNHIPPDQGGLVMKQSQQLLENAATCARLAERATDPATQDQFRRAERAWRALADEQDWLDGEAPPVRLVA
jgi:hypothetical protein